MKNVKNNAILYNDINITTKKTTTQWLNCPKQTLFCGIFCLKNIQYQTEWVKTKSEAILLAQNKIDGLCDVQKDNPCQ